MSEADEMYEGIEDITKELIAEYENQSINDDLEEIWLEGAVAALNELLRRLNGEVYDWK